MPLFLIKFEGVLRGSRSSPTSCAQFVEADNANAACDKLRVRYALVHLPMVQLVK